jgi:uncharacterized membrane protein
MASTIDDLQKAYAICTGTLLEVLGLIGFVSSPIANVIGVNLAMSFLHLVVGALGWFALKGSDWAIVQSWEHVCRYLASSASSPEPQAC